MKVALYIYTETNENVSSVVASDFRTRVLADGGTFEAQTCCVDTIQSLGSSFANVETAKRIELFEDEKISVTSSIQNVNDISKVFTDYSQSFTIPASDNNNEIFRHWYENSLDDAFDQRRRYSGYIEIDTQTFRSGKWQLESATVKNNRVEDYKITFYGELLSLSDKFGEDKLKDLQTINDYTIEYTGANVQTTITSTSDLNVMFPLISSDRVWQYGGGGAQDISISGSKINHTELFPAIKVARIFDAIQDRYNISFSSTFFNQSRFNLAYLWLKNSELPTLTSQTEPNQITMADYSDPTFFYILNNNFAVRTFEDGNFLSNLYYELIITFPTSVTSNLFVFRDGQFYTTISNTGTTTGFNIDSTIGFGEFSFWIQTTVPTTYTYNYSVYVYEYDPIGASGYIGLLSDNGSGTLTANLDLTRFMPDMKVSDFFSGILKMFNLTAFSEDGTNYTLEQLENWYYQGQIKDYSEYCITDFEYNKVKPYKKINFEYEKSENRLNRNFGDLYGREFGNLSYPFNNDGGEYTVKLPFENIMFNKFTGTQLQVAYALKSDLTKYIPKPVILYKYENRSCSFYFNNGSTTNLITTYNVFGQEVKYLNQPNTLNWGVENSTYLNSVVSNTLFSNYYLNYLSNLYSLKSRMVKVKMRLPYLQLLNLKLNDRIVIRDKRYVINQFTTDLTTFESDFELIQDFRSVNFNNGRIQQTDNTLKTLRFDTTSVEPLTWSIESDPDGLITSFTDGDTYVDVVVKDNVTGLERTAAITSNLGDRIIIIQDA
jgi:hypothetical protein